MKLRWWLFGCVAAAAAGVAVAHWWAPKFVLVPASAQPEDAAPLPVPPIQAATAPRTTV
ncbi:MAG: hypothetical protein QM702_07960 [Rubrivivax sp.]